MSARMVTAFALGYFAFQLARPIVLMLLLIIVWLIIELLRPALLLTQLLWAHEILLALGPATLVYLASQSLHEWVMAA